MVDRGSQTSNRKKKNGLLYGRFMYLPRSKCSCGDWLGSRFLLVTCYIIGKWQRAVHMLSVVWRIHGDTLWSLLECNLAKCVWALEKEDIIEFIGCLQEQDARAWLAQTFSSLPQEDLVRVTINMWAIWYARRKAIHEAIFQSPLSTHSFVERFISDLNLTKPKQRAAQHVHDHHLGGSPHRRVSPRSMWMQPCQKTQSRFSGCCSQG